MQFEHDDACQALPAPQSSPVGGLAAQFGHHRHEIRRFLQARCGNTADADDLLQELWIRLSTIKAKPIANGRAYLFRMANNLALDLRRSRSRAMTRDRAWIDTQGLGQASPEHCPDPAMLADEALEAIEQTEVLKQAIESLPKGAALALQLHRLEGIPQSEVARIMGISLSGVEKHLALAMRHLRRNLIDKGQLDCGLSECATSEPARDSD